MKRLTLALAVVALAWLVAGCAAQPNGALANSAPYWMALWLFLVSATAGLTGCGSDNNTGFVPRRHTSSSGGSTSGNTTGGTGGQNTGSSTTGSPTGGTTSPTDMATKLAFVNQPGTLPTKVQTSSDGLAAVTPLPAIEVAVEDANGNIITTANGFSITLSVASSTLAGGHLFPTNPTAPVVNGIATFSNVELSLAGVYTLVASVSSPPLASATSSSFTVGPLPVDFAARTDEFEDLSVGGASIVSADFNNDGHADLVLSRGYDDPNLTVLLTNSDGTFQPPVEIPSGFTGLSVGAGLMLVTDLNGDQKPDLVIAPAQYSNTTVGPVVLLGCGDGTFAPPQPVATGFSVAAMTVADFDGDHKPDLAVASGYPYLYLAHTHTTNVKVFKGGGDGTFGATLLSTTVPTNVLGMAAGDFNADSSLDLAVITAAASGGTNGSLLIYNGNGTNLTTPAVTHTITGYAPTAIVSHNFDGDGADDLAVAEADYVAGVPPGSVTNPGTYLARVCVYFGGASGLVSGPQVDTTGAALSLQAVDIDGNGTSVVGFAGNQGRVFSMLSHGADRTFGPLHETEIGNNAFGIGGFPTYLGDFAVGDFDGDGIVDVATANYVGQNLSLLHGNGDGTFFNAPTLPANPNMPGLYYPTGVTVADLGDGHPALIWNSTPPIHLAANGSVFIARSNGDGTFAPASSFPVPAMHGGPVVLGDFNNDTKPDLLLTPAMGTVHAIVLPGNGDGTFGAPLDSNINVPAVIGLFLTQDAVADFDGDNNLDLAMTDSKGIYIAFGNGDGTFRTAVNVGTEAHNFISILSTADVNGDNVPDFIASTTTGIDVRLGHRAGGNFTLDAPISIPLAHPNVDDFVFATGDFNGDGHLDFATAQWYYLPVAGQGAPLLAGQIDIFLGNGDGHFQPGQAIPVDRLPVRLVATDLNLDGQLDLLAVNDGANNVSVLTGNGDGTFARVDPFWGTAQSPAAMFVGDINGDGKPDIITGDILSGVMSVLFHR